MTKNKNDLRCIKNRTWEKDRRERLNNTFERLAQLLPDYEAKINFSKIEILQRTIAYIEELRMKFQKASIDPQTAYSRNQGELEDCLRALRIQNDTLVDLLQKSNIIIPPFAEPICLKTLNRNIKLPKTTNDNSNCHSKLRGINEIEVKEISNGNENSNDISSKTIVAPILNESSTLADRVSPELAKQSFKNQKTSAVTAGIINHDHSTSGHNDKFGAKIKSSTSRILHENTNNELAQTNNNKNESKDFSVEKKNVIKVNGSIESLLCFGMENTSNQSSYNRELDNRKLQTESVNMKIFSPCDFNNASKKTSVGSIENAANSEALNKHSVLLDCIQSPQIDLSPTLLSPTAAFLLSFPVVSSTLAKPVEPVSDYTESINKEKQSCSRMISNTLGTVISNIFNEGLSSIENDTTRSHKNKIFHSKSSIPCAQKHDVNNFNSSFSTMGLGLQPPENSLKYSSAIVITSERSVEPYTTTESADMREKLKPPVSNRFINNTFANMNRPCYDQSYSSFWSESPTSLQNSSQSYGLPYYLRNSSSTSASTTAFPNELEKSGIHKNSTTKTDNSHMYQQNLSQWDRKIESSKISQNLYEKKCTSTNEYSNQSKPHVNWMTSDSDNHFKVNSSSLPDAVSNLVNTYHHPLHTDENLGCVSSRMLDSSCFVPDPVLPNLNGDLALSTIAAPFTHSTNTSARSSNIQDDSLTNSSSKNSIPDNNNYQKTNSFSAEALFSTITSNNTGSDSKRQKMSSEYFNSSQNINSNVGFVSNAMTNTAYFPPSFENLSCTVTNTCSSTSQKPPNNIRYPNYSHQQNIRSCNERNNSHSTNTSTQLQSTNTSYKNAHNISSKVQLPFSVPVFLDTCRFDPSLHNQMLNQHGSTTQTKIFDDSLCANGGNFNKLNKMIDTSLSASNLEQNNGHSHLDRSSYGNNGQQSDNKIIYSNSASSKSKSQFPFYNHSFSLPVNSANADSTISNTITNFNLSTICPEIDRDFLIKERRTGEIS